MQQSDPFYNQLPFTLQEEHFQSEYIILGTGLKESILAAYLSKMQNKKVLVFDQQKTYGSCIKTINLKQVYRLSKKLQSQRLYNFVVPQMYQQVNENFFQQSTQQKATRGYNIDIEPSMFFGNSITCQCLKQADMDKYMDFRLVNHLLKYQKGKFNQVPLSKGKIFQSKNLSLSEKKNLLTTLHTLIKLFQRHMNTEQDHNSTKQFDKGFGQVSEQIMNEFNENKDGDFIPLLQKITKKNKKIIDFIVYIICNFQYNYSKPLPKHVKSTFKLSHLIQKFGKFINSCGIYGQSPYLYVDNGVGDIPQAFSRIASIFGSTFILHPKLQINSIRQEEDVIIKSNIAPGKELKVKQAFYGQTFYQMYKENHKDAQLQKQNVFRLLLLCKKSGQQEQCPSIVYFIDLEGFQNPVYLLTFDESTHSCPAGYILYQFSTIMGIQNKENLLEEGIQKRKQKQAQEKQNVQRQMEQKAQILIGKLKQVRGNNFNESIKFVTSYVRTNFIHQDQNIDNKQKQVLLKGYSGLDLDGHFDNFIGIVGKKQNYFRKKNPYQDQEDDEDEQTTNNILHQLNNIQINNNSQIDQPNVQSTSINQTTETKDITDSTNLNQNNSQSQPQQQQIPHPSLPSAQ